MANLPNKNFRLEPKESDFLNKKTGSAGEILFDKDNNTLKLYDGTTTGGFPLVSSTNITDRFVAARKATVYYTVTIVSGENGNLYVLNNEIQPTLSFVVGYTYVFDQSDQTNVYWPNPEGGSNNQHPLNFSADNLNGELGGGTVYTTNVFYKLDGKTVDKGTYWRDFENATSRQVWINVTNDTPSTLYYWCQNHLNMGAEITVADPGTGAGGASIDIADSAPINPRAGALWFNSNTGSLYVYISDTSGDNFWVQPSVPVPDLSSYATKAYTDSAVQTALGTLVITNESITTDDSSPVVFLTNVNFDASINAGEIDAIGANLEFITFSDDSIQTTAANLGNIVFNENTVTSADSSDITFTPKVNFSSDVQIDNQLVFTDGTKQDTAAFTGNVVFNENNVLTSDSSAINFTTLVNFDADLVTNSEFTFGGGTGYPTTLSTSDLVADRWTFYGTALDPGNIFHDRRTYTRWKSTSQKYSGLTNPTGTINLDFLDSDTWYFFQPSGTLTLNFTEVPTDASRVINFTVLIAQGATPYIPTAVEVNGASTTLNWQLGVVPTGSANDLDMFQFSIWTFSGPAYVVLGHHNNYT